MFIGEYKHSIDAKGRVSVPAKYREQLGERFFVSRGLDKCLYIYPTDEWEKFSEKINSLPLLDKKARQVSRFLTSGVIECEVDKQGRILISAQLRNYANLEKEVVFAGVTKKIEIWDSRLWEEQNCYEEEDLENMAEHLLELGLEL